MQSKAQHQQSVQEKVDYDVIIIGAGIVGLTLACALAQANCRCAVIEAREQPKPFTESQDYGLRVSAITRASENIFKAIGVWSDIITQRHCPYYHMQVWDKSSTGEVSFSANMLAQPNLGYIVENDVIEHALSQRAKQLSQLTLMYETHGAAVSCEAQPIITLTDGQQFTTHCLVGADGARSWLREQLGLSVRVKDYAQSALVANIRTEKPHDYVARQIFLDHGPLAFLPMADEHLCSIVWSQTTAQAKTLTDIDIAAFNKVLTRAFDHRLGECQLQSQRAAFPLRQTHATHYTRPGCVLIGDAAHTIHPLAGQGLNIGLLDAAELADVFIHAKTHDRPLGSGATLRRYERARRWHNGVVMRTMDCFHHGFTTQQRSVVKLRELGMHMVNRCNMLKLPLVAQAMGMSGPLPKMAQSVN